MGLDIDPASLAWVDQATGAALLVCGLLSLTRPCWPVLIPVTLVLAGDAAAPLGSAPGWLSWLGLAIAAATFVAPVALMLVDWYPPRARFSLARFLIALLLARYAVVATFLAIGVKALHESRHAGSLVRLVQAVPEQLAGRPLHAEALGWVLTLLGAFTIAFALNMLIARNRGMAAALVAWGLLLLVMHLFAEGARGLLEMAARFAWLGLPTVLLLYWSRSIEERGDVLRPQ